ncbi:hypothetical protein KP509_18G047500 [Ceratopteris richardii]|uniref:Kinesin-like protein n=1 Tax=Ceratopteris richardii TaxID=49495 RepID=A0A8T2SQ28_CERRI|nr:hypothetical protein KP509_18G047500 [Ceratopteris richardii]KAH7365808.1 hypothetical protein KP509_18G047500 [Ceratopteris richardii]
MDCSQSAESLEKVKLARQCKMMPFERSDSAISPVCNTLIKQPRMDDFSVNNLQSESSPGIFDVHAENTELLSEGGVQNWWDSTLFQHSPFSETSFKTSYALENCNPCSPRRPQSYNLDAISRPTTADRERNARDNAPAKIKVVVRKRPINKKELARSEEDIICIEENGCYLTVHEPKLKVDLTAYVERHEFVFDAILDQDVSNEEVYMETVGPIIPALFERTKATCFAYGQTGSGKTYTMQPLPLKASEAILQLMQKPGYMTQGFQLWLSFFEIYGGKLFDLLNDRRKLCMREDGRQQVCIIGLKEFQILDLETLKEFVEKGSLARSTGTTGANEESSRSHAILQLSIRRRSDTNEKKRTHQVVGKISFIDLAGSERGADTTDNDRQTRLEGAEINKSLLALKECIRALDSDQSHIPFRGSKLTEVLRDSFVGDSRTVMISCISPSSGSCEHTLNTLRYADRVKGLSRNSGHNKREISCMPLQQEPSTIQCLEPPFEKPEQCTNFEELPRMSRPSTASGPVRSNSRLVELYQAPGSSEVRDSGNKYDVTINNSFPVPVLSKSVGHWQNGVNISQYSSGNSIKDVKNSLTGVVVSNKNDSTEERTMRLPMANLMSARDASSNLEMSALTGGDGMVVLLKEEDNLISAHCKELEDTINFIREEMKLLAEVEQPGSQIDVYVSQLSKLLSKKAAGLVNLQAQLAKFQKLLKEQEIVSLSGTA